LPFYPTHCHWVFGKPGIARRIQLEVKAMLLVEVFQFVEMIRIHGTHVTV